MLKDFINFFNTCQKKKKQEEEEEGSIQHSAFIIND
jgi:hypothetical protein